MMQPSDFDLENGTLLGCGSIAYVNRCQHKQSKNFFAIKAISKIQALQQNKTPGLKFEKQSLQELAFYPGVVHSFGTMQSQDEIYFILENLTRGDLQEHIRRTAGLRRMNGEEEEEEEQKEDEKESTTTTTTKKKKISKTVLTRRDCQKILIQCIFTLKLLWERNICSRDVKPENWCFHSNGRIVMIDFDTVLLNAPKLEKKKRGENESDHEKKTKRNEKEKPIKISEIQEIRRKSNAFCGTAQYVSPETLANCDWTFSSDLFAVGSMIYFMLAGRPFFDGDTAFAVLQQVHSGVESVPREQWSQAVRDCKGAYSLIRKLLSKDPFERFCRPSSSSSSSPSTATNSSSSVVYEFDFDSFKAHEFFHDAQDLWDRFEKEDTEFRKWENCFKFSSPSDLIIRTPCSVATSSSSASSSASSSSSSLMFSVTYDDEPKHDDEYAQYAMKASTSDFERWWQDSVEKVEKALYDQEEEEEEEQEESKIASSTSAATSASGGGVGTVSVRSKESQQETSSDEDSTEEEMNVIDDVGQQRFRVPGFAQDTNENYQALEGERGKSENNSNYK